MSPLLCQCKLYLGGRLGHHPIFLVSPGWDDASCISQYPIRWFISSSACRTLKHQNIYCIASEFLRRQNKHATTAGMCKNNCTETDSVCCVTTRNWIARNLDNCLTCFEVYWLLLFNDLFARSIHFPPFPSYP